MAGLPKWVTDVIGTPAASQASLPPKDRLVGLPRWFVSRLIGGTEQASITRPTVDSLARAIVGREGGFVNDPDDPGGATNFGVTIGTMRALGLDLNNDGVIDVADVKLMTADKAVDIFKSNYFDGPKLGLLPEALQSSVFDMQVNAGSNAVTILQQTLNSQGFGPVSVDGGMGPETAAAAKKAVDSLGESFVDTYGVARRDYYYRLGDRSEKLRKFATTRAGGKGGWISRAEEFMSPTLRLTEDQHTQRVQSWNP
jgi:lysozyme family protein